MRTIESALHTTPLADLLRFAPLFASLPAESPDCFRLLQRGEVVMYGADGLIARAGTPAQLLVVLTGEVVADGPRSKRWRPGEHLGDVDLLLGRPVDTDLTAAEPTLVYRLDGANFHEILAGCHLLVRGLLVELARRSDARPPHPHQPSIGDAS